jgi:hypothetical protein
MTKQKLLEITKQLAEKAKELPEDSTFSSWDELKEAREELYHRIKSEISPEHFADVELLLKYTMLEIRSRARWEAIVPLAKHLNSLTRS